MLSYDLCNGGPAAGSHEQLTEKTPAADDRSGSRQAYRPLVSATALQSAYLPHSPSIGQVWGPVSVCSPYDELFKEPAGTDLGENYLLWVCGFPKWLRCMVGARASEHSLDRFTLFDPTTQPCITCTCTDHSPTIKYIIYIMLN